MFRRCGGSLRHPYAIDLKKVEAARRHDAAQAQVSYKYAFKMCARRAWEKARRGYDFFFPEGGKGGPAR
ncbi:hypothetical protein DQ04_03881090 [Trypanosoma grayi]|uniref:hypothetical protein n=1 Tax=Trypanosoma grayi TaxID=71804 RepID=UPI0004F487D9|nr:hypothetical protein DQ04_03881090 [Trypanosoma grayi]KEG10324.1 hypothetical protein DQ04_03881090 [Trypanosoma grayi]